ncbi:hypothetical protein HDU78_004615 [Chytriomyces hyalinus]|uniref:Dynactin subunit 6 n=1 Tax=Chytriomyces confervae TaxID=246404 RepID=A0A507FH00_9FUNG|nr:hypothetical protein HDU78_004615 [Chytriomyces hyalinus]TPX74895.1 hypothetical protein CcCBS67573_g03829 [Chytriomyces confervae]
MFTSYSSARVPPTKITAMGTENIICEDTEIQGGSIHFGGSNIVHPKSKIRNEAGGAIVFGNRNIIEEGAVIINWSSETLNIGSDNLFEVGCVFEGLGIGDGCVIEPKARILPGASLGDNCVVGAMCKTFERDVVPNDTVIFGGNNDRRIQTARSKEQEILHTKHIEYLKDVLKRSHPAKAGITQTIGVVS